MTLSSSIRSLLAEEYSGILARLSTVDAEANDVAQSSIMSCLLSGLDGMVMSLAAVLVLLHGVKPRGVCFRGGKVWKFELFDLLILSLADDGAGFFLLLEVVVALLDSVISDLLWLRTTLAFLQHLEDLDLEEVTGIGDAAVEKFGN